VSGTWTAWRTTTTEVSGSVCPRWWQVVRQPSESQIAADTGMTIDTSLATCAGHQPSGGRSFRKQRTVNPLTGATRYKFPCAPAGPSLRAAACGEAALAGSSYADATACGRLHQPSQATSRGDC
jgi:hypothetical protein